MKPFQSYVFEEDEISAHNQAVLRERPLLFSFLLFCLGFILAFYFDYVTIGIVLLVIGIVLHVLATLSVLTPKVRTGELTKKLIIYQNKIQIGDTTFSFSEVTSVHIKMYFHEGQFETDLQQTWKSKGTNNEIIINDQNKELKFRYWLPSYQHVMILRKMDFPNNVSRDDRVY